MMNYENTYTFQVSSVGGISESRLFPEESYRYGRQVYNEI